MKQAKTLKSTRAKWAIIKEHVHTRTGGVAEVAEIDEGEAVAHEEEPIVPEAVLWPISAQQRLHPKQG